MAASDKTSQGGSAAVGTATDDVDSPGGPSGRPRSLIIGLIVGVVAVVGLVVLASSLGRDDASSTAAGTEGTPSVVGGADTDQSDGGAADESAPSDQVANSADGTDENGDGSTGGGSADPDGPAEPELAIPVGTIPAGEEHEVCAATIERLRTYRQLVVDNGGPTFGLVDAVGEFEADLFMVSEAQPWGESIIERLTTVRRQWVTAMSAADAGDTAESNRRTQLADEELVRAIATDCPPA